MYINSKYSKPSQFEGSVSLKNTAKCEVAVREVNIFRWKMGLGEAKTHVA